MAAPVLESIEALLSEDVGALDDEDLKARTRMLVRLESRIDAALLATTAEIEQRNAYVADGMVSTRAWLAHHTGMARTVAGATVWLAKRLRYMPQFTAAMAEGR